jgi:hypothetical protein
MNSPKDLEGRRLIIAVPNFYPSPIFRFYPLGGIRPSAQESTNIANQFQI